MNNKNGSEWALMLLKVVMGIGFMVHGWAKLSHRTAGFEKLLIQTGVPMAHLPPGWFH